MSGNLCRCTGYKAVVAAVMGAAAQPGSQGEVEHGEGTGEQPAGPWTGRSVARKEDRRLVMGAGEFTDDFQTPRQLYCALVRSTRAHARIRSIDVTTAASMPGVVRVVTGAEAKQHWLPLIPTMEAFESRTTGNYALAVDVVRYVGEPMVAIVAETRYEARDAAAAVEVEYDALPVVASARDAGEAGEPTALLYDHWGDNKQTDFEFSLGDVDAAFGAADIVVDDVITSHRWGPVPLEMRVVHADYRASDGRLTVRLSTQTPHQDRTLISRVFGLSEASVRIIAGDVGGGFGAKLSIDVEYIPVLMSILTQRPVNYVDTREEWLTSGTHAHDFTVDVSAAFSHDGRILGLRNRIVTDLGSDGAERAAGMAIPIIGAIYVPGPYVLPAYSTRAIGYVTNKAPYGGYRGYGKDIANVTIERVMDHAADALGLDRLEIRRRNLLESYPHQMISGPVVEDGSVRECLDKMESVIDVPAFRKRQADALEHGRYLGLGIVSYIEPSGGGGPWSFFNAYESARVRMTPDGTVQVFTGNMRCGQGVETTLAQVTADRLGCSYDRVSVYCGDTDTTPYGMGASASRGVVIALGATLKAADALVEKLLIVASHLLEADPEDLVLGDDAVMVKGSPDTRTPLSALAQAAFLYPGGTLSMPGVENPTLEAVGIYTSPHARFEPDEHGRTQEYACHATGAQAALVEVDIATGFVTVEEIVVVGDVGVVINPAGLDGQITGGTIQSFGGALLEDHAYDAKGNPLATTLRDYGFPNIQSVPQVRIEHIVTPGSTTPVGAKGAGEGGQIATYSCIMSAVEDALRPFGATVNDLPLAPWRILDLIADSRPAHDSPKSDRVG
jgi:carbon-monoxide dehydrogenase large subunit